MRRFLLLIALLGAGAVAGTAGFMLTGSQLWFLCIPAAVGAGWLKVADPTQCQAGGVERKKGTPG